MPINLDAFDQPNDERDPTDFKRTKAGTPQVKSLTKTRKRQGKKADLLAAAEAAGHTIPAKTTVAELHDLLGPEQAWETYRRPSGYGDLISEKYQLEQWKQRCVVLGIAIEPQMLGVMADVDPNDPNAEKKALDRIVTKAHEAADSDLAARRGTWVHELTEWADEVAS